MLRNPSCVLGLFAIIFFSFRDSQASSDKSRPVGKQRNQRDVKADPVLMLNVSWNDTQTLSSGDQLLYNSCIRHVSSSSDDAYNINFKWFFPSSYVQFGGLNQTSGPVLNTQLLSSLLKFEVGHLSLYEDVCFILTFIFDPSASLKPGRHFVVTHTQLVWEGRALPQAGTEHHSSSTWHAYPFNTISVKVEIPGCSSELGITNGYIKDHQMTSSSYRSGYEAFKAKLDGPDSWCSAILNRFQFLQIDFIHKVRITKISVRGFNISIGVEQFDLEYSMDGQKWDHYTEYGSLKVFHNTPSDNRGINSHWILDPFDAYSIRIRPTSWNNSMCLAVEYYGCEDRKSTASCILPLGMESGFITDKALSTSQVKGNPEAGRLNKRIPQTQIHGWLANPFEPDDYLQIDLAVLYQVTKFGVQGGWTETKEPKNFVKKYTVKFSNGSNLWLNYTEHGQERVFDGPSSSAMAIYPTFARLAEPVVARFVRIFPQPWGGYRVMRLEIYGCLKEPMPPYPVPEVFSRRSYLLNEKTGDFYVCLYRDDRSDSSCKYTKDGFSWENLDSWIVNVLAVEVSRDMIYALDRSNMFLQSSDFGDNWIAISHTQWRKVQSMYNLTLARKIPENLLTENPTDGEALKSDSGLYWGVSNTGVHIKQREKHWDLVSSWKCCTY